MLDVDVPAFFLPVDQLLEAYLERPAEHTKKALVEKTITEIDTILSQGNPLVDEKVRLEFENYLKQQIQEGRSYILIVALKRADLYTLFKLPSLQQHWLNLWRASASAPDYQPLPHLHPLDQLISIFFSNLHLSFKNLLNADSIDLALKVQVFHQSSSCLAHGAVYGELSVIHRAAFEIFEYLKKIEIDKNAEERASMLIKFLEDLLENAPTKYLNIGQRLKGYGLIKLAEALSSSNLDAEAKIKKFFEAGITCLYQTTQFENLITQAREYQLQSSRSERLPVISCGHFSRSSAQPMIVTNDIFTQLDVVYNNTQYDGFGPDSFAFMLLPNYINTMLEKSDDYGCNAAFLRENFQQLTNYPPTHCPKKSP